MLGLAYMQLHQGMRSRCAESFTKTRLEERFEGRREMVSWNPARQFKAFRGGMRKDVVL